MEVYLASSTSIFIGIIAALTAAILFGIGDFGAGELGKKMNPIVFLSGIYIVEIPLILIAMTFVGEYGTLQTDFGLFLIGIFGTLGFACIIYGLSHGHASIVMSLAGLLALVVPVIASVILGEDSSILV